MVADVVAEFNGEKSKVNERPRAEGPMVAGGDVILTDDDPTFVGVTGGRLKIGNAGARTTTEGDSRARSWTSSPGLLLGDMINAEGKGESGGRVVRRGTVGRVYAFDGGFSWLALVDNFVLLTTLIVEEGSCLE